VPRRAFGGAPASPLHSPGPSPCAGRKSATRVAAASIEQAFDGDSREIRAQGVPATPDVAPRGRVRPGEVRIVGLGKQGVETVNQLVASGVLAGADFWCIDTDAQVLARARTPNVVQVQPGDESMGLLPTQIDALSAKPDEITAFESRQIRAMLPSRSGAFLGVLFLVGSAASAPGVARAAMQLASASAANGRVVVAALSRPLSFEGARRAKAAEDFVASLRKAGVADVVAVVDQDVLMGMPGSQALTVEGASAICSTALEQAVLCVMQAAGTPEVLKVTRGALMWCRHQDPARLELPMPLRQTLRREGVGAIGKGSSSCPLGPSELTFDLMAQLAGDAVVAASRSPFLAKKLAGATAALVCLTLPSNEMRAFENGELRVHLRGGAEDAQMLAKVAVQAGANAVRAVLPAEVDVAVCATPRGWAEEEMRGVPGEVVVEASVVLIYDPARAAAAEAARAAEDKAAGRGKTDKAMWGALSALAGGGLARKGDGAGANAAEDKPSPWVSIRLPAPPAQPPLSPANPAPPPPSVSHVSPAARSPRPYLSAGPGAASAPAGPTAPPQALRARAPSQAPPPTAVSAAAPEAPPRQPSPPPPPRSPGPAAVPAAPVAPGAAARGAAPAELRDVVLRKGAAPPVPREARPADRPAPGRVSPAPAAAPAAESARVGASSAPPVTPAVAPATPVRSSTPLPADFWDDGFWEEIEEVPEAMLGTTLGLPPGAAAFRKQKRLESGEEEGGVGLFGFGRKSRGEAKEDKISVKERAAKALEGDRKERWGKGGS